MQIRDILEGGSQPPMYPALDPTTIDALVSGHTHLSSLEEAEPPDGKPRVLASATV